MLPSGPVSPGDPGAPPPPMDIPGGGGPPVPLPPGHPMAPPAIAPLQDAGMGMMPMANGAAMHSLVDRSSYPELGKRILPMSLRALASVGGRLY